MIIDFRQGIVSYDITTFPFIASSFNISLIVGSQPIIVTVAQGNSNYTYAEPNTVNNAWTVPSPTGTYWLYWDFNTNTFARTFGYTAFTPVAQAVAPPNPQIGQMWYNTVTFRNYVWTVAGWTEILRVFACQFIGGNPPTMQFVSMGDQPPLNLGTPDFRGTQIGDNMQAASGTVVFDYTDTAIRKGDGTFFTTEDVVFANGAAITSLRLESNVYTAISTEPSTIAAYAVVAVQPDGSIQTGSYTSAGSTVVGVALQNIPFGGTGAVCVEGTLTNVLWNWTGSVGQLLWVSGAAPGNLQPTDPHIDFPITYPVPTVPVARVLSPTSIMFLQGIGTVGPPGPPGSGSSITLATPTVPGIVTLSVDGGLLPVPTSVVVSEIDPRLTNARVPLAHTQPATSVTVTPDIPSGTTAPNVQLALQALGLNKLNLSGGTMTGVLTLAADPVSNFQAATKQYVDNSITAAEALAVLIAGSTMTGNLILNGNPTLPLQAATKQYVDSVASGLTFQAAVVAATTANLNASYAVGPAYTLTSNVNAVFTIDGVTPAMGARVLIKDQTAGSTNGIYDVTNTGSVSTPWILTRDPSSLPPNNVVSGTFVFVSSGTQNNSTGWVLATPNPITLDTTSLMFVLFSSIATITYSSVIAALGYVPVGPFTVTSGAGISVSGSPVSGGAPAGIVLNLSTELQGLNTLATLGFVQRTGVGSYIAAALTSLQITTALGYIPLGSATINTTAPLTGGGPLIGTLTLSITSFAGSSPGAVPLSPGGTTQFLRADGQWAVPAGGGGGGGGTVTSIGLSTTSTGVILGGTNPITTAGTITVNLNAELQGLAALATVGTVQRTGVGTYVATQGENTDIFFATASQTVFNLTNVAAISRFPGNTVSYIQVFVNGVLQREDNATFNALAVPGQFYVSSSSQITFAIGLNVNDEVMVYQLL